MSITGKSKCSHCKLMVDDDDNPGGICIDCQQEIERREERRAIAEECAVCLNTEPSKVKKVPWCEPMKDGRICDAIERLKARKEE